MKYIIMADGKGTRWHNSLGKPKHLVEIDGEKLIERTVRLLHEYDKSAEVIITSHDTRYNFEGATRYEPLNNVIEIDRFTYELIEDNICFLYGDTFYTEESIEKITGKKNDSVLFFGTTGSIVAVKISNSVLFRKGVDKVKQLYLNGEIESCIGWQVYQCLNNYPYGEKIIGDNYITVDDRTININKLADLAKLAD